jgi:hypothetical protein
MIDRAESQRAKAKRMRENALEMNAAMETSLKKKNHYDVNQAAARILREGTED